MPGEPIKDAKEPRAMRDWAPYFLPLLRPLSRPLGLATLALVFDAVLTVMRPWPLKVVIDRVLSHRASRVPLLRHWLDNAPYSRIQILYGVCAAMLLIALLTGLLTYYYTRLLGDVGQRFVFAMRRTCVAAAQSSYTK